MAINSAAVIPVFKTPSGEFYVPLVLCVNHPDPKWKFPCGDVEGDADIRTEAIRELKEETGCLMTVEELTNPKVALLQVISKGYVHKLYVFGTVVESTLEKLQAEMHKEDTLDGTDILRTRLFSLDDLIAHSVDGTAEYLGENRVGSRHRLLEKHTEYFRRYLEHLLSSSV